MQRFIESLAEQLTTSLLNLNIVLQETLQTNNQAVLEQLPKMISDQFMKALENQCTITVTTPTVTDTNEVSTTEENEYLASVDNIIYDDSGDEEEFLIDALYDEEENE